MLTIRLPYPDRRLSPNARLHWAVKSRATIGAKSAGRLYARDCVDWDDRPIADHPLRMTLTFHPPDRRRRDLDNAEAAMKAYIDGVFSWLDVDDSIVRETVKRWGDVVPGGEVVMELEEM